MLEEQVRRDIRAMLMKRGWYAYHPPDVKVLISRPDLICLNPTTVGCIIEVKKAEVERLKNKSLSCSFGLRQIPQIQRKYLDRRTQEGLNVFFAVGTTGKRIRFKREILLVSWKDWYTFEKVKFDHDIEEKEEATIKWGVIRDYFKSDTNGRTCFLEQVGEHDWILPENHLYYEYFWTEESRFSSIEDYVKLSLSVPEPKKKENKNE